MNSDNNNINNNRNSTNNQHQTPIPPPPNINPFQGWNNYPYPFIFPIYSPNSNQFNSEEFNQNNSNIPMPYMFYPFSNMMYYPDMSEFHENIPMVQIQNEDKKESGDVETTKIDNNGSGEDVDQMHFEDVLTEGLPKVKPRKTKNNNEIEIPEITWLPGQRGNLIPFIHGHAFHHSNGNSYVCKHHKRGCEVRACIYTETEYKYTSGNQYTHEEKVIDYLQEVQKLKNKTEGMDEKNAGLTANEIFKKSYIPGASRRKSTSIRQIKKVMPILPSPKTIEEIQLTQEERKNLVYQDDIMLVFADKTLYDCFRASKQIFLDGSFKSVPKQLYYQIYTVHCECNNGVFPVFYALLIDKKNRTYERLFKFIEQELDQKVFHEKKIVLGDFEVINMAGFGNEVEKRTCFFHFTQCMWRRAQSISVKEYKKNGRFKALCRSLMILPLMPKERIQEAFDFLRTKYTGNFEKDMLDYFEENYMNGAYDRSVWWIGDLINRTNNSVESFNGMFNRLVRIKHPSLHTFIPKVNEVIEDVHRKAEMIVNEDIQPRQKKAFKEKNRSIYNVLQNESKSNIQQLIYHLVKAANINDKKFEKVMEEEINNMNDNNDEMSEENSNETTKDEDENQINLISSEDEDEMNNNTNDNNTGESKMEESSSTESEHSSQTEESNNSIDNDDITEMKEDNYVKSGSEMEECTSKSEKSSNSSTEEEDERVYYENLRKKNRDFNDMERLKRREKRRATRKLHNYDSDSEDEVSEDLEDTKKPKMTKTQKKTKKVKKDKKRIYKIKK